MLSCERSAVKICFLKINIDHYSITISSITVRSIKIDHNIDHCTDIFRSSHPEMFLRKGVLKIRSKFTGEHTCRSVISIKLLCAFIEIALRHRCSPVNLLHIFRTPFPRKTSGWLLLYISSQ